MKLAQLGIIACLGILVAGAGLAFGALSKIDTLFLTTGTYASSPVLLRELRVNGGQVLADQVVYALSDQEMPRSNGNNILNYPSHRSGGNVTLSATWVELRTNKAWRASVSAPVSSFVLDPATNSIRMAPVFGPNGLLILTSDPIPMSATDIPKVDVAKTCGAREATADFDKSKDAQVVGVAEMRTFEVPLLALAECPAGN